MISHHPHLPHNPKAWSTSTPRKMIRRFLKGAAVTLRVHNDFRGPFWHRFFIIFVNDQKPWNRWQFYTFNRFWLSKDSHFPIKISLFFHVFSKPLPGTVSRGSRCRSLLKSLILVPFSIFGISRKVTFGHPFRQKCHRQLWLNRPGTDIFWLFLNIVCFCFFDSLFCLHFGCFWLLSVPFWLHVGPFGSNLTP